MGPPPSDKPTPLRHSYWVLPGKVLAGEHPGGTNRDATRERLKRLIDAGVECFIDLTEPGELKPYDPELPFSVEYLRKPIKDHGIPSQRAHMAEILDCVHDALQSGRCVYIHCRAGIGRTGTVVGCLLVERGLVGEAAVDELNRLWQQNERSHSWPSVPETPDQTKYIVSWKPRGIFDDQGALTPSNMLSPGSAPGDDPDDAPSPGGADRPWAYLLGDAAPSAGANSARTPPPPARAPGATHPIRPGPGASRAANDARPGVPSEGIGASRTRAGASGEGIGGSRTRTGVSGGGNVGSISRAGASGEGAVGSRPRAGASGDRSASGENIGGSRTRTGVSGEDTIGSRSRGSASNEAASGSHTDATPPLDGSGPISIPTNASAAGSTAGASRSRKGASRDATRALSSSAGTSREAGTSYSGAGTPNEAGTSYSGPGTSHGGGAGGSRASAPSGTPGPSAGVRSPANPPPDTSAPPAAGIGSSRAAIANAARAAASGQSDDDEILSDPTSVAKLPQPTPPRSPRSGPAAPNAQRGSPATSGAQRDSAAANARPSGSAGMPPNPPSGAGGPTQPRSAEPSWISTNGRTERSRAATAAASSSAAQQATSRSGSPSAPIDGRPISSNVPIGSDAAIGSDTATGRATLTNFPPFEDESDPLLSPEALAAVSHLRDRFIGALVGLAVGDAVAAATQYRRPGSFTPVGDMLGGGPFDLPRGGWTDDTSMALCLADSLLERNGFDARDQVERYHRWQTEGYLSATGQCVGITASSARAIAMAKWRRQAFFGSHDPSQQDPEPLSRVTPSVLFFFATSGEAINQATEAARTTCQAPAVLDACRALASAVYAAVSGQPKAVVLAKATLAVTASADGAPDARSTGASPGPNANGSATGESGGSNSVPRVGISAPAALAAAVQAFAATDNFRDAILYAANLGGDSDVVAAACGQLAGAYYTVKAIPTSWLNGLMQKELILGYADRLLAHAVVALSG